MFINNYRNKNIFIEFNIQNKQKLDINSPSNCALTIPTLTNILYFELNLFLQPSSQAVVLNWNEVVFDQ